MSATEARSAARIGTRRLRGMAGRWLPGVPLLALIAVGLVAPLAAVALDAFRDDTTRAFTFHNVSDLFANPIDRQAIATSLRLGVICACVATAIGLPLAWTLGRMASRRRSGWLALLNVAAQFTGIPLGFAFVATLGTSGIVSLALSHLGAGGLVPARDTVAGLVVAYSYFDIPLFVLLVLPAVAVVRADWWEAAQASGATRRQFWRFVGGPVLAPFALAGWLLLFAWSIGQYAAAYALAGTGAGSRVELMTLRIGQTAQTAVGGVGRAAVHAVLLILFSAIALGAYRLVLRRAGRWIG